MFRVTEVQLYYFRMHIKDIFCLRSYLFSMYNLTESYCDSATFETQIKAIFLSMCAHSRAFECSVKNKIFTNDNYKMSVERDERYWDYCFCVGSIPTYDIKCVPTNVSVFSYKFSFIIENSRKIVGWYEINVSSLYIFKFAAFGDG